MKVVKRLSASGVFTPHQGLCLWTLLEAMPQAPIIGSLSSLRTCMIRPFPPSKSWICPVHHPSYLPALAQNDFQYEGTCGDCSCLIVCTDIRCARRTADNVRCGINVHLYSAGENGTQWLLDCLSFSCRSLATHQRRLSLFQGSIHKSRPCA